MHVQEKKRHPQREREIVRWGGADREGERIPSRLLAVSAEPDTGLNLTNSEIMT